MFTLRAKVLLSSVISVAGFAWGASLAATTNLDPIPSFYQDPGISPHREYVNQQAHELIDPFTGKLQLHYVDMFVPGAGGFDIKIHRSYSSGDGVLRDPSPYGMGWTMGFGRALRKATIAICDTNRGAVQAPVVEMADGSRHILYSGEPGKAGITDLSQFISATRMKAECAPAGMGLYVYTPEGTRYEMTTQGPTVGTDPNSQQRSWYTTRIIDRNGNVLNIGYLNLGEALAVSTVTASDGRKVTFTYTGGGIATVSDGTRTFNYTTVTVPGTMGGYRHLTEVKRPDSNSWKYTYDPSTEVVPGAMSMKSVTYPTGGSYSYTYDSVSFNVNLPPTHVIKTKTGDGGVWTFTYEPSTGYIPDGQSTVTCSDTTLDRTTVVGPDGTRKYCHYGYNSSNGGLLYAIGVRAQTVTTDPIRGVLLREGTSIQPAVITTRQNLVRPGNSLILSAWVSAVQVTGQHTQLDGLDHSMNFSGFDQYGNPGFLDEAGTNARKTTVTYHINAGKWITGIPKDETIEVDGKTVGTITRLFDANGNKLSENKFGVASSWTYYSTGDLQTYTDPRLKTVTYRDYKRGSPQTEDHPEAVTIRRVIDDLGNLTSETDGELNTTSYTYDGLNRIKTVAHPRGNSVTVDWDSAVVRRVTRGGARNTTTFDAFGRVILDEAEGTFHSGARMAYLYDAVGRRLWVSDPGMPSYTTKSTGTQTDFDILGRPRKVKLGCASFNGACDAERLLDHGGNKTVETSERKYTTEYVFRTFGHPDSRELMEIHTSDPALNVKYERNGVGQVTTATQAGVIRTFKYNTKYFLEERSEPETGITKFGRDDAGNMTSRQVGASAVTNFVYDDLNRLKDITYPTGTPSVSRTYYRTNRLKTVSNGVTNRAYEYDANGNPKKESLSIDGQTFATLYDYDGNDGLSLVTYGSGRTIDYMPDPLARPTQALPFVQYVERHPTGVARAHTYTNGVYSLVELDSRLRPASLNIKPGGDSSYAQPYVASAFKYTKDSSLESITDTAFDRYNRAFGYDNMDRLRIAYGSWGKGLMEYDARGNFASQSVFGSNLTYTYDTTANRLATLTGYSPSRTYSYDAYGNVSGDGTRTFRYDDSQGMVCAKCGTASEIAYVYDGLGLRVKSTPTGASPTYSIYDSHGTLLWETVLGQWVKEFVYLDGKQVGMREVTLGAATGGGSTSLAVSLTADNTAPAKGTIVTFRPQVNNTGTMAAQTIKVMTAIAPNMEFVSVGAGCTTSSGFVVCTTSSLNANTVKVFDFKLKAAVSGPTALTAGVSSTTALTNPDTSSSTINLTVGP